MAWIEVIAINEKNVVYVLFLHNNFRYTKVILTAMYTKPTFFSSLQILF
jgi:hypothetical protein